MIFRPFGVAAVAATLLLPACATALAPTSPYRHTAPATSRASSGSCPIAGFWVFHGSCVGAAVPITGMTGGLAATISLPRYRGIRLILRLAGTSVTPGSGSSASTLTVEDATGRRDITGTYNGGTFPAYPSGCVSSGCPGRAFLYFAAKFSQAGRQLRAQRWNIATADLHAYPGTACAFALLQGSGWTYVGSATASPKGRILRLHPGVMYFFSTPRAYALVCR